MSHGTLFPHFSQLTEWRWPNFSARELACPCCGEFYLDAAAMDRLQGARDAARRPFHINSAHRCPIHNARVGGAPLSAHKLIAFDISILNHERAALFDTLKQAGFGSFGFYQTFIHADTRPGRRWYGKGARRKWTF